MSKGLVSVELDLREFNAGMNAFRRSLLDWRPAILWFWSRWVTRVYQAWTSVRRGGGSFRGHEWDALKDTTREKNLGAVVNIDTGQMMRALFNSPGAGSFKVGPPEVQNKSLLLIGNNMPDYAAYAMDKGGRNPAFFAIPEDEKLLLDSATMYIEAEKKKAFKGK
jgi:hypothetical protein